MVVAMNDYTGLMNSLRLLLAAGGSVRKGSTPNKYKPHQGAAECERRCRQMSQGRIPEDQILRGRR